MNSSELAKVIDHYLNERFRQAEKLGWSHLILRSGLVHRDLTLVSRVPSCCLAMRRAVIPSCDHVLQSPPSGNGTTLTIQYHLPRPKGAPVLPLESFIQRIRGAVNVGERIGNLNGKSVTTLLGFSPDFIKYRRGDSVLRLPVDSAYEAYNLIAKQGAFGLTTSELKSLIPRPFSNRHKPCHATFLFQLLVLAGLIVVSGTGKRSDPFRGTILSPCKM
jgi:hypothetical protein